MADAEYSLGSGGSSVSTGLLVPTKIMEENILSNTSEAWECFVGQKFSAQLQVFLISYNIGVNGLYSVYV